MKGVGWGYCFASLLLFLTFCAPAFATSQPTAEPPACTRDGVYAEAGHICFIASIRPESRDAVLRLMRTTPGDLYIRSAGGEVSATWDIGRQLSEDRRGLVVLGPCYSSCANYLVPAAARIEVRQGGVILLHGSPPRDRVSYVASVARARGLSVTNPADTPAIRQIFLQFRTHYEQTLLPETRYFIDIAKSEQYVVRYFETLRNIELYANQRCEGRSAFLLVGPRYLEKLAAIRADRFWWPQDRQELVDLLGDFSANTNFVFDLDLLPGWIAGQGLVSQADCLRSLDTRPTAAQSH